MNRKNLFLLIVVITGALAIMSGCMVPQVGAPGPTGATIGGRVATPESCFTDACDNPFITEGEPLPGAIALFYGGDSGKLEIEDKTECNGAFEVNTTGEGSYVLYVVREHPEDSGNYVVVKKGINNPRGDVGEANVYTTSQVIIWERANALYGEDFVPFNASWYAQYDWKWSFDPAKLVLPVSEIPNLEPTKQLIDAVEKALSECRDPQEDNKVIHFADKIANATFGAPGGGGAAGGGGGGGVTPAPADEEGEDGGAAANRGFTVTKSANPTTAKVGDTITYTVTVKNTGNSPLTGVTISDTLVSGTLTLTSGDTDNDGVLDANETWVYTYTYTVQGGDAGKTIHNMVTVDANGVAPSSAYADVTVASTLPPTPQTSTIIVKKVVEKGEDGTWSFIGGLGNFDLTTSDGTATSTAYPVTPGQSYTITETTQDNWSTTYKVGSADPVTGNSASITAPAAGETLTVTFTNTYTPPTSQTSTITVVKNVVDGEDGTWSFIGGLGNFDLTTSDGTASTTYPVTPGQSYTITETTQDNWSTIWSTDPDVGSGSSNSATVTAPDAGKTLTVTFTNTYTPPPTGVVKGKIGQHNGQGYGRAIAHFRDVRDITKVYSVNANRNGIFSITLPAGSYVFWADKESGGDKWYTSIGYEPRLSPYWYWYAPYPNGVQCITLNPGEIITNASIWIKNSGGHGVTPRPVPAENSCL